MTKTDWIEVGLRLLGVFFVITGLLAILQVMIALSKASGLKLGGAEPGVEMFLVPAVQVAAGIGLLYLRWPAGEKTHTPERKPPMPEYLEKSFDQMEGGNTGS